jgi:hypothetical protein
LYQNYPNQFNPATQIEYDLKKEAYVRLSNYNVAGQKIKTLVNNRQQVGNYKLWWKGSDDYNRQVCSGVYVYQIACDGYVIN